MKVKGSSLLDAPPDAVFRAVCDPGTLMAVIPGCEAIDEVAPGEYHGRIRLRLPGMVGAYRTTVTLVDAVPPSRAGMEGRLEGSLGSISGRADLELTPRGSGTLLEYRGTAVIDGPLARLDSRFAESLAETLLAQGLRSLNQRLVLTPSAGGHGGERPSREVPE